MPAKRIALGRNESTVSGCGAASPSSRSRTHASPGRRRGSRMRRTSRCRRPRCTRTRSRASRGATPTIRASAAHRSRRTTPPAPPRPPRAVALRTCRALGSQRCATRASRRALWRRTAPCGTGIPRPIRTMRAHRACRRRRRRSHSRAETIRRSPKGALRGRARATSARGCARPACGGRGRTARVRARPVLERRADIVGRGDAARGVAVDRNGTVCETRIDRRARVVALELAVLPLSREEPQRIAHLGAQAACEVGAARTSFQPVPAAHPRHAAARADRHVVDGVGAGRDGHRQLVCANTAATRAAKSAVAMRPPENSERIAGSPWK